MNKQNRLWMICLCGLMLVTSAFGAPKPKVPKEWGHKVPWRNWAHVITLPALQDADALADGDLETLARPCKGGEAGSEFTLIFPKPLNVTMLRFAQVGSSAKKFKVMADLDGKKEFKVQVLVREDKQPIKKEMIDLPINRKVFGLKLVFISGEIGFRSMFPFLSEVELYAKENIRSSSPRKYGAMVQTGAYKLLSPFTKRNIDIRICTDTWNYGNPDKPDFAQGLIDSLQELDANSVRLFDETWCGDNGRFPFLTDLVEKKYTQNWMKPATDLLAKHGYKLYYMTHAWKPPFQERGNMAPMPWCRWDYPYHQSDTVFGLNKNYKRTYPCVICQDDYRTKWTHMMRDVLRNGAAGVYLMPDEWFFKGHNLARANCPYCTAEFKKMFGYDSMPKPQVALKADKDGYIGAPPPMDTEQYRKWKVFEYIKQAELFRKVAADLRKDFPQAQLVINPNLGLIDVTSCRLEHTITDDIIGMDPVPDFAQVYGSASAVTPVGQHIAYIKRFEGAFGKNRLLSSAGWGSGDLVKPIEVQGGLISEVMLGAKIVEVYRQNYMYMSNGVSVYKKAFRMIRLLEQWGIDKAQVPELVGMLYSRASEDWYYTKVGAMMAPDKKGETVNFYLHLADESINKRVSTDSSDDLQRFLAQDRFRGFGSRLSMESLLTANGIPYKVAFTERPDNMKNLKRFKLLVMPFSYSLSKSAFAEIKAAVEAGTKLIIFEQLAPTDEFGNRYEKPLLAELIGKPGVTYIKESLADTSADALLQRKYLGLIEKAIKDSGYGFANNGSPVSYVATALPDNQGYILYLGNYMPLSKQVWGSGKSANVVLSLPGTGNYRMETYSSLNGELNVNKIKGQEVIPAKTLEKFMVNVLPQEVKLIRIYR